jgi:hypothetical protein
VEVPERDSTSDEPTTALPLALLYLVPTGSEIRYAMAGRQLADAGRVRQLAMVTDRRRSAAGGQPLCRAYGIQHPAYSRRAFTRACTASVACTDGQARRPAASKSAEVRRRRAAAAAGAAAAVPSPAALRSPPLPPIFFMRRAGERESAANATTRGPGTAPLAPHLTPYRHAKGRQGKKSPISLV